MPVSRSKRPLKPGSGGGVKVGVLLGMGVRVGHGVKVTKTYGGSVGKGGTVACGVGDGGGVFTWEAHPARMRPTSRQATNLRILTLNFIQSNSSRNWMCSCNDSIAIPDQNVNDGRR